jgi:hypothetical protein
VIEILRGVLAQVELLVIALVTVVAIVFVISTWVRTRSLVPTLGAVLLGAVVIYGVQNFDFLQGQVEKDFENQGQP